MFHQFFTIRANWEHTDYLKTPKRSAKYIFENMENLACLLEFGVEFLPLANHLNYSSLKHNSF